MVRNGIYIQIRDRLSCREENNPPANTIPTASAKKETMEVDRILIGSVLEEE